MKPEIQRYLDEHGATFTPEALRRGLLDAGYDPVEVDTALREWEVRATDPASAENQRRRFWRLAFGLHAAVLVVIAVLSLAIGSFAGGGWGVLLLLAVVLLIGVGISGLVGRGVLRGSGLTVALLVPAISALLIGGSCLALAGPYLLTEPPPPPTRGTMELQLEPPLSFDGSGAATCQAHGGTLGFSVFSEDLGALDGSVLSVSLELYAPRDVPGAPQPAPGAESASLFISLLPQLGTDQPVYYSNIFSTRIEIDASPDGVSGTAEFQGLEPAIGEGPPGEAPGLEPISGTISWSCE